MKILQIINSLSVGGAERLISETIPLMKRKGLIVDVLLLRDSETPFKKQLEKEGIKVLTIKGFCLYSPLLIFKIRTYIKGYDIVHVHLFPAQYWVALANLLNKNKQILVTTEHNTINRRRGKKIFKYIDKFIYSQYNYIIGISSATTSNLVSYLNKKNKIETINNGINIKKYLEALPSNRFALGYNIKDFILIMVAGFREQKDQDTLIESLCYLPEDVKVLLVGDGERKSICEDLCRKLNLEKRVIFLGIRTDIPSLMKMSDVVVVSSHWEGFGLVAVEGMAAMRPLIASNVSGLADIVEQNGLLFAKGNAKELATHVIKLKQNRSFYDEIAKKCHKRSLDFNINKMVDETISLYKEILKEKKVD